MTRPKCWLYLVCLKTINYLNKRKLLIARYTYLNLYSVILHKIVKVVFSCPWGVPQKQTSSLFRSFAYQNKLSPVIYLHYWVDVGNSDSLLRQENLPQKRKQVENLFWLAENIPSKNSITLDDLHVVSNFVRAFFWMIFFPLPYWNCRGKNFYSWNLLFFLCLFGFVFSSQNFIGNY